jgi:hypothetical protein
MAFLGLWAGGLPEQLCRDSEPDPLARPDIRKEERNPREKGESMRLLFPICQIAEGGAGALSRTLGLVPHASPLLSCGMSEQKALPWTVKV